VGVGSAVGSAVGDVHAASTKTRAIRVRITPVIVVGCGMGACSTYVPRLTRGAGL
jgi:hypothetical protein